MKMKLQNLKSKLNDRVKQTILSFDVNSTFNPSNYYVVTGLTLEHFNDFCSKIPLTKLKHTDLPSLWSAIVCLLVKLRLGLSHKVVATLVSFSSRRDVGHVLDAARQASIKYFVRKHLGFSHIPRGCDCESYMSTGKQNFG